WGKAFGNGNFLDDAADAARGQPPTAPVDEQSRRLFAVRLENFLAQGEIRREGRFHGVAKGNIAFLFPFAADEDGLGAQSNVVEIDARKFGVADAASVEQFQHKPVA